MPNRREGDPDDVSPARDYDETGAQGTQENAARATGGASDIAGAGSRSASRTTAKRVTAKRTTAAKKSAGGTTTAKKAAAKKSATTKSATTARSAGTKSAAKKAAGSKTTAAKRTGAKTAGPKSTAARKTAGTKTVAAKKRATGGTKSATRARATGSRSNGRVVASLPPGKIAADYGEAKRALGTLWEDVTKQTYSAFNSIAGRVEKNFNQARQTINEIDVRYALEKTQSKLKSVAKSGQGQVQTMARQAKLLYQMLMDAVGGRFKVPWATVSAATAALLYFISPIDILPDFIPGAGLIDDALVISMAISLARMDLKRYIQENELNASEYGL